MRPDRRLRLGIIGCGDVAHRHYLPPLADLSDRVEIRGLADPRPGAAEAAARTVARWSPGAQPFVDIGRFLAEAELDAVFNLTPAPIHGTVNRQSLEAGLHVYSEKPLASSVAEADALIATARERGVLLLAAPATAVTRRFRWLAEIVASERYGRLSLVVGHTADPGPAAWREYTGDPTPFYGPGVGPVFDHGVYRLHGMTTLMGPVRRVQAMGAIGVPRRVVRGGPLTGRTIEVTAPDSVLLNLEFANGGLGQLLASFGTANTLAPWLELHFERATISFPGSQYDKDGPASIYLEDEGPLGLEGWSHDHRPPPPDEALPVVETGVVHFIAALRGEEAPALTAEHARHVLDIVLKAYESVADGRSHETETTFSPIAG
jgi:predicted dehydrogenase